MLVVFTKPQDNGDKQVRAREEKEQFILVMWHVLFMNLQKYIRRGQVLHENIEKLLFCTASETVKYSFFAASTSHRHQRSTTTLINDQLHSVSRCLCISSYQKQLMILDDYYAI